MTTKEIALPLTADMALADAVSDWKALEKDRLLQVGDTLNEINNRSQLAIGAWLTVFEDNLGYGAIKDMADRWDRKPQTLMKWKSVYRKTQNLPHAVDSLPFSKVSELARIPAEYQFDWLESVESLKRAEIRAAIKSAKESDDWTPPTGDILVLEPEPQIEFDDTSSENGSEPEPESSDNGSEMHSDAISQDEPAEKRTLLERSLGRLSITVEWQVESEGGNLSNE